MSSYFHSPIVTLGLDPRLSKVVTQGYGPEVIIEILLIPSGGGRGGGRRKKDDEDRLIRIRVISEDGKTMIQERLVPLNELSKISIKVKENESFILHGSDIYIKVQEGQIKEGEPTQIRIQAHETPKR